jgi:hypothetical protein
LREIREKKVSDDILKEFERLRSFNKRNVYEDQQQGGTENGVNTIFEEPTGTYSTLSALSQPIASTEKASLKE